MKIDWWKMPTSEVIRAYSRHTALEAMCALPSLVGEALAEIERSFLCDCAYLGVAPNDPAWWLV